jgi:hypothetical protein
MLKDKVKESDRNIRGLIQDKACLQLWLESEQGPHTCSYQREMQIF